MNKPSKSALYILQTMSQNASEFKDANATLREMSEMNGTFNLGATGKCVNKLLRDGFLCEAPSRDGLTYALTLKGSQA
jgi:hypothetical protein